MPPLSGVQGIASANRRYEARVRQLSRIFFVILAVLLIVPGWTGGERLPLFDRGSTLRATGAPVWGGQRRIGRLSVVGAVVLTSDAPAFGGFSAISVRGARVTLLNDGGNWIGFALNRGQVSAVREGYLPGGPEIGWAKRERDSESLAVDPATGTMWVGFENANAIWRYSAGFARGEAQVRPAGMADWPDNGGAETLVRLRDGRFIVLAEQARKRSPDRPGLIFAGDPTRSAKDSAQSGKRFAYRRPPGYVPSDAAELPNGDLLVVNRRFSTPYRFSAKLTVVPRRMLRPGATLRGTEIATIGRPSFGENFEGVAVTVENGATMIWMIADEDVAVLQRTLLVKFRLD